MNRTELLEIAKPILFNTDMVRAILDGRKMVTRRVTKIPNGYEVCGNANEISENINLFGGDYLFFGGVETNVILKPRYKVGDILYVRETWCERLGDISKGKYIYKAHAVPLDEMHQYVLDQNKWRPSIHMPKEAARIFLRVTDVRVERLQEITEEQAKNEGVVVKGSNMSKVMHILGFAKLWDGTIKKSDIDKYGWNANPWVWVYEFEVVNAEC